MEWEKYFATAKEIKNHNDEVKKIWDAYHNNKPIRVPTNFLVFNARDLIYRDKNKSFIDYYKNPEEMLKIQAEAQFLANNIIVNDIELKDPEKWSPILDYETFTDESYWGCEIFFSERQQPKLKRLYENEKVDPEQIPIPDPLNDNIMHLIYTNYLKMKDLIKKGYKILGKTFSDDIFLWVLYTTDGIFNTAVQLRGTQIFMDFYEDPDYVKKLLNKVSEGYIIRSNAWSKIANREKKRKDNINSKDPYNFFYPYDRPIIWDHEVDMISMEHYEEFLLPVYKKVYNTFGEGWDRFIDFCGHGERLPIYWYKNFGVKSFTHLNAAFVDLEKLRYEVGPDVELQISIHPAIMLNGPESKIVNAVKEVLTPEIKGKGNLIMISATPKAPIENVKVLYESVKEYGYY